MTIKLVLENKERKGLSFTAELSEPFQKESTIQYKENKGSGRTGPKWQCKRSLPITRSVCVNADSLRLSDHPLVHLPEHSFSSSELHSVSSPIPVWNELSLVLGELTFQETKRNLQN